ncbi:MAG: DUF3267 domain-containing protein [Bacteroidales bacterium]|nr:DUF3267 domain-containing protein [Bacteroidales bacterium]
MKQRKVTINIVSANVFAILIFLVAAISFGVPYVCLWHDTWHGTPLVPEFLSNPWMSFLGLAALIGGIVVHELIHGITWACFAPGGWQSISFGVMWKLLTPYCHCDEPLRRSGYLWGGMMPCIVLGIIPAVLSLFTGSFLLLIWGIIFISAAAGDIWMCWLLLKEKPGCLVLDHPSEAGFYIYEEE